MRIELDHNDFEAFAKKMESVINANEEHRSIICMRIERYGIPFKVEASSKLLFEEVTNGYETYQIDEVSFYGLNTNNVSVVYDSNDMERYGSFRVVRTGKECANKK